MTKDFDSEFDYDYDLGLKEVSPLACVVRSWQAACINLRLNFKYTRGKRESQAQLLRIEEACTIG